MSIKPDKDVKKAFKKVVSKDPDKYFATSILKREGYKRTKCKKCSTYFWSVDKKREVCDDANCSGGFRFFKDNPAKKPMDYVTVWKEFTKLFKKRGYTAIDRYPVIARWRDDTDFVQASIYDFQPYVVKGEIDPPANPLVIPQFSLRFNDIDNVGITMSHMTGFVMIGQHAFMTKKDWDKDQMFEDIYAWLREGMGLPKNEITFHEDAWAGGGNYGPCMEFFSRGCELGNQVYMLYEQSDKGQKELELKVLDMGMGHERVAWFTQGEGTIYDATFPHVMKKLYKRTSLKPDEKLIQKYLPLAAYLNIDEIDDTEKAWADVAQRIGMKPAELRDKISPLAALYSVAEHSRTLLVALNDGGLPSNVGGGYNLRVILRRSLAFIEKYGWDINLQELVTWHAQYLKPLFPELSEHLEDVHRILAHEQTKYQESRVRNASIIERSLKKGLDGKKLIELYDSHGISPEELQDAAHEAGIKLSIPDNFYALLSQRHEQVSSKTATKKEKTHDISGLVASKALYFDHYDYVDFEATIQKVMNNKVILDRTAFYPTSGGQLHDIGTIDSIKVAEVTKQANRSGTVIIHHLDQPLKKKVGDRVAGKIDFERRRQLTQHHSATHLLTGSARAILGNHVWQAGASKTMEKSRLDITHYKQITNDEMIKIERMANKIIDENRPVYKQVMARDVAEAKYGFRLYQGGAVPGKKLRIVDIKDFDVEACGGTHVDVTGDIGHISIIKSSKIQDGIVRLEFVAGNAAKKADESNNRLVEESVAIVGGKPENLPGRAIELFNLWKKAKKGKAESIKLTSSDKSSGDVLVLTAQSLKTQPEHVPKTLRRFMDEAKSFIEKRH